METASSHTGTFLDQNRQRFVDELTELLRIPSVSADPACKGDVRKAAEWLKAHFERIGADEVRIMETPGHPLVYAEKLSDPSLPTVLIYGHYDVQPPDPLELWNSPPFEPVIADGKIYARGACDDKGQMFMHLKALECMLQSGPLPVNLKFMIEGEEEVGSEHLGEFLKTYKDKLAADVVLVSDTSMLSNEQPSITTGLRGLSYVEVELRGPNRDLHSGVYGGAVANPINALCRMIGQLIDEKGRITIPGFYDDVLPVSKQERDQMGRAPFDLKAYQQHLDIDAVSGEEGYSVLERTSIRPTLDVNGIWGGYIGEGAKTILPSKAQAKISMRLVPNQHPDRITKLFSDHFKKLAPAGTRVSVTPHHGGLPALTPIDHPAYHAAAKAMEQSFGIAPIPLRSGGSIPIVALFEETLGLKTILFGFGLDSDAIHSPNEHFGLFNFFKGIETLQLFHEQLPLEMARASASAK